jgi:6-phosphogluconate dehydrogenase
MLIFKSSSANFSFTDKKGTGKMTMKEAADSSVACSTMSSALDARFIAFDKDVRVMMAKEYPPNSAAMPKVSDSFFLCVRYLDFFDCGIRYML